MNTPAERRHVAARAWGLVALGAQLWIVVQFLTLVLEQWGSLHRLADYAVLDRKLSQLKPAAFKFPNLGIYVGGFLLLGFAAVLVLWWLGLREALRPPRDPDES